MLIFAQARAVIFCKQKQIVKNVIFVLFKRMFSNSALDLWSSECDESIITLIEQLDYLLGKRIPFGSISEFCGVSGSGKTQLCLQLCVNVQIQKEIGLTNGGKAVFIETRNGFSPDRLTEIAGGSIEIFQDRMSSHITVESLLKGIMFTCVENYIGLLAAVHSLKELVENNSQIRLVIIDSFSFCFRSNCNLESLEKIQIINEILTDLQILGAEYKFAVSIFFISFWSERLMFFFDFQIVITNEFTTKLKNNEYSTGPALGESHSHKISQRIILDRHPVERGRFIAYSEKGFNCSSNVSMEFEVSLFWIKRKITRFRGFFGQCWSIDLHNKISSP